MFFTIDKFKNRVEELGDGDISDISVSRHLPLWREICRRRSTIMNCRKG